MQCTKCGAQVDVPSAVECPRCGVLFSKLANPPRRATSLPAKATSASGNPLPWIIAIVIAAVTFALWPRRASSDGWYRGVDGYDRGVAERARTHKPLLVYFYTDWCPHCRTLERRAFSTPEFRSRFASLIKIKVNPENGKREHDLADRFQITGYPTVFVVDGNAPRFVPRYRDVSQFFAAIEGRYSDSAIDSGSALLDQGKAEQAGEQFDRAQRENPNDPEPHYLKGVALVDQNKRVEAAFEFQNAIRIKPHAPSYEYLAWLALEKGNWGDALEYASKGIELDPTYEHGRLFSVRAEAYARLGKTFEASQDAVRGCSLGDADACKWKQFLQGQR